MSGRRIYLDHAATTPLRPEVREAMEPYFSARFGNPSSLHAEGREAREGLEAAREALRDVLQARGFDLVFTSGGTEADNLALLGAFLAAATGSPRRVLVSAVEHPAVLETRRLLTRLGGELVEVPVDREGRLDLEALERGLAPGALLVSVMAANNETGVLEPLEEAARLARRRGVLVHTDAVQLLGKELLALDRLPVDLFSLSAHKVYGPRGVGALLVRRGVSLEPLLGGGGQEGGLRSGTEAVALAVGFARAVELAEREREEEAVRLREICDLLRSGIAARLRGAVFNTPERAVLPSILNVSFPRIEGQSLVKLLSREGVAASTGSACSTGKGEPSHVLRAMGRSDSEVRGSLRLSLGRGNRREEIPEVVERLERCVSQLVRLAPA